MTIGCCLSLFVLILQLQVLSLLNPRIDSALQALGAIAVDSPARLDEHVRVRASSMSREK